MCIKRALMCIKKRGTEKFQKICYTTTEALYIAINLHYRYLYHRNQQAFKNIMKYIIILSLLFCNFLCSAQQPAAEQVAHDKARAAKGDTAAMYHMGMYYCYGTGMPQDFVKAKTWLQKAADKGHPRAMLQLGMIYEEGKGVKKDATKALTYFRKAAKKGDRDALYEMGVMYSDGIGVKKDMAEAIKNFKLAGDKGSTEAMNALALCYAKGNGVPKDVATSLQWLQKAAEQGDAYAMNDLGFFYSNPELGNDCIKAMDWYMKAHDAGDSSSLEAVGDMTMDKKCKDADEKKIAQWMKKYADQGDGDACFYLAEFYMENIGVEHNYVKAMNLFMKDADILVQKNAKENDAIDELFTLYDSGNLGEDDQDKILKWLEETADKTNDDGLMAGIGYIYTNKEHATRQDYANAMKWSMRCADKGNPTGYYNVGYLYANGLGVREDDAKGFEWIMKAAEKGDKVAMGIIADFYEKGQGVPRNRDKAAEWRAKSKQEPQTPKGASQEDRD